MKTTRYFHQDFLFEGLPIDEQDYPTIVVEKLPRNEDANDYLVVSFDLLFRMNKEQEWETFFERVKNRNICVKDDVPMKNPEMDYYKTFYLRAYCYVLSRSCRNIYVTA